MSEEFLYDMNVDFSDVIQMTVFRCEGVQNALEQVALKYDLEPGRAADGVILTFKAKRELTDEERQDIHGSINRGWENYLATK